MDETVSDPIIELINDHRTVDMLFRRFDAADPDERPEILQTLIQELETHATVEEKAIYPAMKEILPDGDPRIDDAIADHARVKEVLARLDGADANDPEVIADVKALAQEVQAHASEEEGGLLMELRENVLPARFTEIAEKATAARHAMQS